MSKKKNILVEHTSQKWKKLCPSFHRNFIAMLQFKSSMLYFVSTGFLCFPIASAGMLSSTAWRVCQVWPPLRGEVQASKMVTEGSGTVDGDSAR